MASSSSTQNSTSPQYSLLIRQNPDRGRMCGFSDTKDRRKLDPPPILQLIVNNDPGRPPHLDPRTTPVEPPSFVCHASLWSGDGTEERNVVVNPRVGEDHGAERAAAANEELEYVRVSQLSSLPGPSSRYCHTLVGSLVAPCTILTDLDDTEKYFFVFHDVSVRTQGQFRLKFHLIDVDSINPSAPSLDVVLSEPFEIFSPKTFPGMSDSTDLSKCFARQGMPIHIRRDIRDPPVFQPMGAYASSSSRPPDARDTSPE
ncbi:velvet factor [Cladochytrium replicatum]|nr:velvet factor [Cladochytrium replicatum]